MSYRVTVFLNDGQEHVYSDVYVSVLEGGALAVRRIKDEQLVTLYAAGRWLQVDRAPEDRLG